MSDVTKSGVAFRHDATAETNTDLFMLVECCSKRSSRPVSVIAEEYRREFSYGTSFTYVQRGKEAIPPPMEWIKQGEDDNNFCVFRPGEADVPYWRLKTYQESRHAKTYEVHVFYFESDSKPAHVAALRLMLELKTGSHYELYTSFFGALAVKRLGGFLPVQALEKLVEKNPEGANEYLDAKDKAYHFFIGIKSLTIRHSNVITWNMMDDLREEVHIMRDANDQEMENLLRKEKK